MFHFSCEICHQLELGFQPVEKPSNRLVASQKPNGHDSHFNAFATGGTAMSILHLCALVSSLSIMCHLDLVNMSSRILLSPQAFRIASRSSEPITS